MKPLMIFLLFFFETVHMDPIMDAVGFIVNRIDMEKIKALNINFMCQMQLERLFDNQDILVKMFDAASKFPYPGMLDSGRTDLGNYDECIEIDRDLNGLKILGKYCFAGLVIPDINNMSDISKYHKLATCIPDACSADDLLKIANGLLFRGFPPIIRDDICSTKYTGNDLSMGNIIVMYVLFLLAALVCLSSLWDCYCRKSRCKAASHPFLTAFSAITNTEKICKVSLIPNGENIGIFNGFRVISMAWIIAGHAMQAFTEGFVPLMNFDALQMVMNKRVSTYLYAATLAVSTFFYMSGFLMSFLYFKKSHGSWIMQIKNVPLLYVHRYIRLTFSVLILYLMVLFIIGKLGDGPLWNFGIEMERTNCKKYWWSYFLYIQNYANWDEMCIIPSWYLSADMQLFLLSPLILIPISVLLKKTNGFKYALLSLVGLNVFFILLNLGIRVIFPSTTKNEFDTHGRLSDYFIGVMMGFYMRFRKDRPFLAKLHRKTVPVVNILIWILVLVVMISLFLFYHDALKKFSPIEKSLFYAFGRPLWAVGLSWIVYSCYHGHGGFVNWFLTRPIFQILGKLSYSMYLIHYLVIGYHSLSNRIKYNISVYLECYIFCGHFVGTLLMAYIWTLAIESPILTIEKHLFSRVKLEAADNKTNSKSLEPA